MFFFLTTITEELMWRVVKKLPPSLYVCLWLYPQTLHPLWPQKTYHLWIIVHQGLLRLLPDVFLRQVLNQKQMFLRCGWWRPRDLFLRGNFKSQLIEGLLIKKKSLDERNQKMNGWVVFEGRMWREITEHNLQALYTHSRFHQHTHLRGTWIF